MRALFFEFSPTIELKSNLEIAGDSFHHLVNVVRVRVNDTILLLNGIGATIEATVAKIDKRSCQLQVEKINHFNNSSFIDVALGVTKREAWDQMVKICVETGVGHLTPLKTQYSQNLELKEDRLQNILVSALEQSNNPFLIAVDDCKDLSLIKFEEYKYVLWFITEEEVQKPQFNLEKCVEGQERILILIGPEGGWGPKDFEVLNSITNAKKIHIPIPIMRAPTALNFALGFTWKAKYDIL